MKSFKLLLVSSFYQNGDLEANTDTNDLSKAMDQQVDADQQNAHVLQYVNAYKWTVSFNIVRIFPLYQSSIGYNSDCTAVISTKFHPQAIAANMKSVKIVQNDPTNDTKEREQKLLFSKKVKAKEILLQSIVTFVKTTSNATRPASATIEMRVLLSLG